LIVGELAAWYFRRIKALGETLMKRTFAVLLWAMEIAASAQGNSIVYLGTDPSVHYPSFPQAVTLAGNAARYAGGNTNPKIAYVDDDPSFGGSVNGVLTSASLTQLTQFTPAGLAAANLSLFDVVYIGATASASSLAPAAANVQSFVSSGGGLVAEAEVHDAASWTWLPYANLIGHSGVANVGHEAVSIVAPLHPVMAGLTNSGMSNWNFSVHSTFSTPGLAGFTTLSVSSLNNRAQIIALDVPEPASVLLGSLSVIGLLAAAWRRRRKVDPGA
jgi:hypothetical protein